MSPTDGDQQVLAVLHAFLDNVHLGLLYEDRRDSGCADLYFEQARKIAHAYAQPGAERMLRLLVRIIRRKDR